MKAPAPNSCTTKLEIK